MATITRVQNQVHNAEGLLDIYNPAAGRWTCVGYAPSQHRRCQNPIALHNRTTGDVLLRSLAQGTRTDAELRHTLHEIAGYLLCRRYHQDQAAFVAARWHAIIKANLPACIPQPTTITLVNHSHSQGPAHNPGSVHNPVPVHNQSPVDNQSPSSVAVSPEQRNSAAAQQSAHRSADEAREDETRGRTNGQSAEQSPETHQPNAEQARPSRSTVRRARETFISNLEAQERSRREAEAKIEVARQLAEVRRIVEDIQVRLEAVERRDERLRIEREQAQQEADARERAGQLQLVQARAEEQHVEQEQVSREAEARDRLRQRIAHRQQEDADIERKERQAAEVVELERSQWDEAWATYEQDWENMTRINTFELDEDVKESVPWPVRSGQWQDVSPGNIREFFQNAPRAGPSDPSRFRDLLRRQMRRWHEDRIRRCFPRIADDEESLTLAVVVMQVINAMMEEDQQL